MVAVQISELQHYCFHAEGQSDEFEQSQAEWRQHFVRANTEGAQFRNLYEDTRIANAGIAPEELLAYELEKHNSSPRSRGDCLV